MAGATVQAGHVALVLMALPTLCVALSLGTTRAFVPRHLKRARPTMVRPFNIPGGQPAAVLVVSGPFAVSCAMLYFAVADNDIGGPPEQLESQVVACLFAFKLTLDPATPVFSVADPEVPVPRLNLIAAFSTISVGLITHLLWRLCHRKASSYGVAVGPGETNRLLAVTKA